MGSERNVVFHRQVGTETRTVVEIGKTLWDHARQAGLDFPNTCGGQGKCGKCLVVVRQGRDGLGAKTRLEQGLPLRDNERLACQAEVISGAGDIHVSLKEAGDYAILTDSIAADIPVEPAVRRKGHSVFHRHFPDQPLGPYQGGLLGLAVDVGTTTLVAQLLDMERGTLLATSAARNPQAAYGDDVITRIGYADQHPEGLSRLQAIVVGAVNSMLDDMEERIGRRVRDQVYEAVVVGNPVMRNLFFGLDVHSLGRSPFEPDDPSPLYRPAPEVGLVVHPGAKVYGAPLVAGQVGADCLADILACEMHRREKPCLMVDIGTNGEVAIGNRERIMAASNAAASAFEGATVSCGTGAIAGAVKSIRISGDAVSYETIGGATPLGLCGSGLIDALAEMMRNGIIDERGRFAEAYRGARAFTLIDDTMQVGINQKDINELRLARAGLVLNQKTLIRKYGVELDGLESIFLVGGFGNYVNIDNAVGIGILPDRKERIKPIGNGALAGARQMLLSRQRRQEAEKLAGKIEHVKLFDEENLLDVYVSELDLRRWP